MNIRSVIFSGIKESGEMDIGLVDSDIVDSSAGGRYKVESGWENDGEDDICLVFNGIVNSSVENSDIEYSGITDRCGIEDSGGVKWTDVW